MPLTKWITSLFILSATFIISCQKEVSDSGLNAPKDSTTSIWKRDSSLLIKSLTIIDYDSVTGAIDDSTAEYYCYDTIHKKIFISYDKPVLLNHPETASIELTYNNSNLLTHISFNGAFYTDEKYQIDVTYDEANIAKKAVFALTGGYSYTLSFVKTVLPDGGYQLTWLDTSPDMTYGTSLVNRYDKDGKLTSYGRYYELGYYTINAYTDSLIYDATGNIVKELRTDFRSEQPFSPNVPLHLIGQPYPQYVFSSHETRGDQLYNQSHLLRNGTDDIYFSGIGGGAGILSANVLEFQYSKYPVRTGVISKSLNEITDYINVTPTSEFDDKGRLVTYHGFAVQREVYPEVARITYYK